MSWAWRKRYCPTAPASRPTPWTRNAVWPTSPSPGPSATSPSPSPPAVVSSARSSTACPAASSTNCPRKTWNGKAPKTSPSNRNRPAATAPWPTSAASSAVNPNPAATTLPPPSRERAGERGETKKPPNQAASSSLQHCSVEGQNPLSQLGSFLVVDSVRRHRDRTPVTGGAILDAAGDVCSITGILGRHFLQSRTDNLVVNAVAGHAGLGREQRLARIATSRLTRSLDRKSSSHGLSAGVTRYTDGTVGLDTLGNRLIGGRLGAASEQGKHGRRSSQNILRNRHLSILIMAIGMRPSTVPGQLREYTAKPAYGKTASSFSDKASHPESALNTPKRCRRHGRKAIQ